MRTITDEQIREIAEDIGVEPALIHAVTIVEGNGSGFKDGFLKLLFEGHVFYKKLTRYGINPVNIAANYPSICYQKWTKQFYSKTNNGEIERWQKARKINQEAADMSASWGMFQILGENYKAAGYSSVSEMIGDYQVSELNQLRSFITFLTNQKLISVFIAKDWATFARRYNGPGYAQNKYDVKLKEAYEKAVREGK